MKKLLVAFVLVAGITAVAFASFNNTKKKNSVEKKAEKKKGACSHSCPYRQSI